MRRLDPRIHLEPMPARLFLSSGDLMADRRFDFARDLQLKGDLAAAADLLLQAIELAPDFASAWFALGDIREELGQREAAVAAFQRAQASDPGDRHGARPSTDAAWRRAGGRHAAGLCADAVRSICAAVRSLAGRAISAIAARTLLFKAVLSVRAAARKPAFFKRAIDLGCGTGLAAAAFARRSIDFIGVDLSPRMIERARATGLYAELEVADMLQGLRERADASADLILAADAMVYVAELAPVLAEAARVLAPGGLLAFTAETHDGEGVVIGGGLRYAHAAAYVREAVECRRPRIVPAGTSLRPQRG